MSRVLKGILIVLLGATISAGAAEARGWHGGWHGGHGWHGGGWRWGGFAAGAALGGLLATPYYYGGPYAYYGGPYAYYGGPYADCYVTHRWVVNAYGYRVWRRVRVCD